MSAASSRVDNEQHGNRHTIGILGSARHLSAMEHVLLVTQLLLAIRFSRILHSKKVKCYTACAGKAAGILPGMLQMLVCQRAALCMCIQV